MRLCGAAHTLLLVGCSHWPHAPPRTHSTACQPASPCSSHSALEAVRSLLQARGRVSLAQVGEHLRSTDTALPDDNLSLSTFVHAHPETFSLTGRPSHRMVALAEDTTSAALVRTVAAVLQERGATSTSELKLRLSERGQSIPGLSTLLRRNQDTFCVHEGTVTLRGGVGDDSALQLAAAASPPLQRLLALGIPSSMSPDELPDPTLVREVVLIDMDNNAFALEPSVARATAAGGGVLVLTFSSTTHNPRITSDTAARMTALASAGRLRLLTPVRDAKNAADFVLSFWVGWLHARLPLSSRIVLASTDIHLERTVVDVLRKEGRETLANPEWLSATSRSAPVAGQPANGASDAGAADPA